MAQDTINMRVTGQEVIDAVRAAVEGKRYAELHLEPDYIDGVDVNIVGQKSKSPYEHLIVLVDGSEYIDPAGEYSSVTIREHSWGGMVHAVGYGRHDVIEAVKSFTKSVLANLPG